jgi:hypothetical protein
MLLLVHNNNPSDHIHVQVLLEKMLHVDTPHINGIAYRDGTG